MITSSEAVLVAAGALVFVMAPLMRAAERAVPLVDASSEVAGGSRARAYGAAVRAALREGTLTSREQEHLAEIARELRVGAKDALLLHREVERESPSETGGSA